MTAKSPTTGTTIGNFHESVRSAGAVVFVRHAAIHYVHSPLVWNHPFFASSRVWIADDRGAENQGLPAQAPDRHAYIYDEESGSLGHLTPAASPTAERKAAIQ